MTKIKTYTIGCNFITAADVLAPSGRVIGHGEAPYGMDGVAVRRAKAEAEAHAGEEGYMEGGVRCRPFTGEGAREHLVRVDDFGGVTVWDDVAGHFTSCHAMSQRTEQRIARRLAAEQ